MSYWDAVEPKRPLSAEKDADKKQIEQEGLDMQWLEMFKLHNSRKTKFISEIRNAYTLIMNMYVTNTLREKMKGQTDFEKMSDQAQSHCIAGSKQSEP